MRRSRAPEIRTMLRLYPDGLSINQLKTMLPDLSDGSCRRCLSTMPDVYIDRWITAGVGAPAAIYCAVEVPEDCPRPTRKST